MVADEACSATCEALRNASASFAAPGRRLSIARRACTRRGIVTAVLNLLPKITTDMLLHMRRLLCRLSKLGRAHHSCVPTAPALQTIQMQLPRAASSTWLIPCPLYTLTRKRDWPESFPLPAILVVEGCLGLSWLKAVLGDHAAIRASVHPAARSTEGATDTHSAADHAVNSKRCTCRALNTGASSTQAPCTSPNDTPRAHTLQEAT